MTSATSTAASSSRRDARWTAFLFVSPFLAGLTLFLVLPTFGVLALSLTDWRLGEQSLSFAGIDNFVALAGDSTFRNSAVNTLQYAFMVTPLSVLLGLWLAVTVESSRFGRTFFRSAFFLPVVSTTVAMAIVWEFILHPTLGPVNSLLMLLDLPRHGFLNDARTVLPTLAAIGIWENAGYNMVLFMAGLKAIPRDLYEAASVDGASRAWERFWTVTFPLLGPTLLFVVLISFLRSFRVFDTVASVTQGGPRRSSEVILFTIYQEGFVFFRVGYASALTVVFMALLLAITLIKFRILDKRVHYA